MRQNILWPRSNAGAAAVTLAICLGLILILDFGRGIWLDEAASFWLSGHDIGFGRIVRERWITDVHPPLYSAYAWALQPLFGGSVRSMRLINLGGLLFAAIIWWRAGRRGIDRDFLALFALLVASSPFFILYAAEFRSYFLQLLLGACLIVQLRRIHEGKGGLMLLGLGGLLLVNLHYFGSLIGLILIGAEAIHLARARRWRAMLALLLIMSIAVVPLALALVAMLAAIEPVAVNQVSALRALGAIVAVALSAALPNVAAIVPLVRARPPGQGERSFARLLVAALAAVVVVYFLLNLVTHNLLPRHMIAAVPIAAALVALLLEEHVRLRGRAFGLICANALLLAVLATGYGLVNKRWETNVQRIDKAVAACPQSRLDALNTMSLLVRTDPLHGVPGIDHVFGLTYRLIAGDAGLPVRIVPDGVPVMPDGGCPALLWVEHLYARPGISDEQLARVAGFTGPISIARLQRGHGHALLAVSRAD